MNIQVPRETDIGAAYIGPVARSKADPPAAGSKSGSRSGGRGRGPAAFAVAHRTGLSPDLRGCAVLDFAGKLLAASGGDGGRRAAADLLAAADAAAGEPAEHVHVGTEDGEVYAVRHDGLAM